MKRAAVLLCALVLCLGLLPSPTHAAGEVYFSALNITLLPLTEDTMPVWVNGVLYVPASMFDSSSTGVSLGIYCSQSKDGSTVSLYNLRQMLIFDLNTGNCRDQHSGEVFSHRAIKRGGRIFLPVAAVSDFFGLDHSYTYTEYGYLVRVKKPSVTFSDAGFIDAAGPLMSQRLKEYLQNQAASEPVTPGDPAVEPKPPENPVEPPETKAQLCLAFRCETETGVEEILDQLEQAQCPGMFLLPEQVIRERDDLVRRILGSGHRIGLMVQGQTMQDSLQTLKRCNTLLKHAARTATTVVLAPEEQREELTKAGWVCWWESLDGKQHQTDDVDNYTWWLTDALDSGQGVICITLDNSEDTLQILGVLLERLIQENYAIVAPLETRI